METTRHPAAPCRQCGEVLDAATHAGAARPEPEDISVCCYCGAIAQYGPQMQLEPVDLDTLPIDVRIKVRRYVAMLREHGFIRSKPCS